MSTAAEREPLLSNLPADDSIDQNGQQKPGIVLQTEVARIPLLTARVSDTEPPHWRDFR